MVQSIDQGTQKCPYYNKLRIRFINTFVHIMCVPFLSPKFGLNFRIRKYVTVEIIARIADPVPNAVVSRADILSWKGYGFDPHQYYLYLKNVTSFFDLPTNIEPAQNRLDKLQ